MLEHGGAIIKHLKSWPCWPIYRTFSTKIMSFKLHTSELFQCISHSSTYLEYDCMYAERSINSSLAANLTSSSINSARIRPHFLECAHEINYLHLPTHWTSTTANVRSVKRLRRQMQLIPPTDVTSDVPGPKLPTVSALQIPHRFPFNTATMFTI